MQMTLYGQGNERYGAFPILNEGTGDACLLMPDCATIPVEYDPSGRGRHYFFHEWNELYRHLPFDCFRKANRYAKYKDVNYSGDPYSYLAFCNAFDCIVYGWDRAMWDDYGLTNADEVWATAERAAMRFMDTLEA